MKQFIGIFLFSFNAIYIAVAQPPFKYDSLYKNMYAKDMCDFLKKHPDLVLIDVRSAGEFYDTSRFESLNQGHLKGAINLDIETMKKDMNTINQYKGKPIVLYCSHSQRSRRVGKLLSENGFTDFYNLNGGMSVLNQMSETDFPCKKDYIVSNLPYKNLSFKETADLLQKEKDLLVIDIRPAEQFNSKDTIISNNLGKIKNAKNIPYAEFKQHLQELQAYKQKTILLYGVSGDGDPARAASELTENGFTNVYQLLGGINDFIASQETLLFIEGRTPYTILNAPRTLKLLETTKALLIYDTRGMDEYNNQLTGKTVYRNMGRMKNAIHAEEATFQTQPLPQDKNTVVLIYGHEESYKFSNLLTSKGYKNVYVLSSFYDFVSSGFNLENCKGAKKYVVNHEGLF
jgi:rhodanese-related sulfurtransferase